MHYLKVHTYFRKVCILIQDCVKYLSLAGIWTPALTWSEYQANALPTELSCLWHNFHLNWIHFNSSYLNCCYSRDLNYGLVWNSDHLSNLWPPFGYRTINNPLTKRWSEYWPLNWIVVWIGEHLNTGQVKVCYSDVSINQMSGIWIPSVPPNIKTEFG